MSAAIRVELPASLSTLAGVARLITVRLDGAATQAGVLNALETEYPVLLGTIRDRVSKQRRPFIRFFACQEDLSHVAPNDPLPRAVVDGREAFLIVGAIAGG